MITAPALHFVLKIASRCNLNCQYCYVYNKGDSTWQKRPPFLSDRLFDRALERIRRYCEKSRQSEVQLVFHGGEPCLIDPDVLDRWCGKARESLGVLTQVHFTIQTNGTLLNEQWLDLFRKHSMSVGVSIDGPQNIHDRSRLDHAGRGSYERVRRGIEMLNSRQMKFHALAVIPLGDDGLQIHRHFVKELGLRRINYLFPDFTHDTIGPIRSLHGRTPCADFLIPIFDHWVQAEALEVKIPLFKNLTRLILGGADDSDIFGNKALRTIFLEADGDIEALDVLKVCEQGGARTGFNIEGNDIAEVINSNLIQGRFVFQGAALPGGCSACEEKDTCGGGYVPHRFSAAQKFDNPSVWCADILKLLRHMRVVLGVPPASTNKRKELLGILHAQASILMNDRTEIKL
jgi:uncharacterized protein